MCSLPHPDLQLYPLVIPVDGLDFKVDAHCADKGRCEWVVCITEKEGGLSDAAVADDEDFKHVIKVLLRRLLLAIWGICRRHLGKNKEHTNSSWGTDENTMVFLEWAELWNGFTQTAIVQTTGIDIYINKSCWLVHTKTKNYFKK